MNIVILMLQSTDGVQLFDLIYLFVTLEITDQVHSVSMSRW